MVQLLLNIVTLGTCVLPQLFGEHYYLDGRHVEFSNVLTDKNNLPVALRIGMNPGYDRQWPIKIDVSTIPKQIQSLIRTNIKKEHIETMEKAEKRIKEQKLEIVELKKEVLKRKLALAQSQKIVMENYLPHLPKRKRWNPFSR